MADCNAYTYKVARLWQHLPLGKVFVQQINPLWPQKNKASVCLLLLKSPTEEYCHLFSSSKTPDTDPCMHTLVPTAHPCWHQTPGVYFFSFPQSILFQNTCGFSVQPMGRYFNLGSAFNRVSVRQHSLLGYFIP